MTIENQDRLLELIGLKSVNTLAVNSRHLALKFQLTIFRSSSSDPKLVTDARNGILADWQQFLANMQVAIKQTKSTVESNDVSLELMGYQLFLYYYLNKEQQEEVLVSLSDLLTGLKNNLELVREQQESHGDWAVLHATRVLILFDYLVRNLDRPGQSLLLMVEAYLLNVNTSSDLLDLYNCKKLLNLYKPMDNGSFI